MQDVTDNDSWSTSTMSSSGEHGAMSTECLTCDYTIQTSSRFEPKEMRLKEWVNKSSYSSQTLTKGKQIEGTTLVQ